MAHTWQYPPPGIKGHWHYSGYRSDGFDVIYFFMELLPRDHLLSLFWGGYRSFIAQNFELIFGCHGRWKFILNSFVSPSVVLLLIRDQLFAVQDEVNAEPEGRSILAEEDGGTSLWNGRAKSGLLALCTPFSIALFFLIDVSMDFKLAASHWSQGNRKWAAYTLGVVALSLFIVDVLSFIFYFSDSQDDNKTWWLKQDKLHVRPWFYLLHFVFCGRIVRYDIFN